MLSFVCAVLLILAISVFVVVLSCFWLAAKVGDLSQNEIRSFFEDVFIPAEWLQS